MGWSSSPDTSKQDAIAATNSATAQESLTFAKQQYADQQATDAKYDPLYQQLISANIDSSKMTAEQSAKQWANYETLFQPLEAKEADTAANYDSPEKQAAAAAAARGDVDTAAAASRDAASRALARTGITPGSARAMAVSSDEAIQQAGQGAGAATNARRTQELTGLSLVDNAVKTGRGLVSTGLQATQLSSQTGAAATGTIASQAAIQQSQAAGLQSAYGASAGINSGAASIYANSTAAKTQADSSASAGIGALAGTALVVF